MAKNAVEYNLAVDRAEEPYDDIFLTHSTGQNSYVNFLAQLRSRERKKKLDPSARWENQIR